MKSHKKCFVMNIHSFVPTPTKLLKTRGKVCWRRRGLLGRPPRLNWTIVSQRQAISSLNPAENEHKSGSKPEALCRGGIC